MFEQILRSTDWVLTFGTYPLGNNICLLFELVLGEKDTLDTTQSENGRSSNYQGQETSRATRQSQFASILGELLARIRSAGGSGQMEYAAQYEARLEALAQAAIA